MPTQLGELSREYFWVAILTAARAALELNHVEAGEIIRSLRDPRQRMAVTQ